MNCHSASKMLSPYLDHEIGPAAARALEAHLAACTVCSARLASLRRLVHGLGRLERPVPPPLLAHQVRRQVAAARESRGPLRRAWSLLIALPLQPALRTPLAMALALGVSLLLVEGVEREQRHLLTAPEPPPRFQVTVEGLVGDPPVNLPQTMSEVAGRVFVLTDGVWVQRGLEGREPETRVDAGSPEGQALLHRFDGLGDLLADGSPVVFRHNFETLELARRPVPSPAGPRRARA
jgi:putative zinc finger protein